MHYGDISQSEYCKLICSFPMSSNRKTRRRPAASAFTASMYLAGALQPLHMQRRAYPDKQTNKQPLEYSIRSGHRAKWIVSFIAPWGGLLKYRCSPAPKRLGEGHLSQRALRECCHAINSKLSAVLPHKPPRAPKEIKRVRGPCSYFQGSETFPDDGI